MDAWVRPPLPRSNATTVAKSDLINLELFVASPGDVPKERQIVRAVVNELETTIGSVLGINIRPFLWEHDLGPGTHAHGPQGLVDDQSNLRFCDILVGIFWNRFGTPTPSGETGSEHEFAWSFDRWKRTGKPHIMLYFSTKPIARTAESIAQSQLLLNFQESVPKEVFSWKYRNPSHFEAEFRKHLYRHVMHVWNERGRPADRIRFSGSALELGLVTTGPDVIRANTDIVSEAEESFFATGSRSRDDSYLRAIEARLKEVPRLVHHRVLMGLPFRKVLKEHLQRLLELRPPEDRSLGFKTLHVGVFENSRQQAEVFLAGNEKRVLIVLPSRRGLGEYNTALIIEDAAYVKDMHNFVKQLYAASRPIETRQAIDELPTLLT
jgi:hypothetical protein